jgi:serine phosphatase RsbU (regulator of sigma subunit)
LRNLVEQRHELTATELSDAILREVELFTQSAPLSDDRTLVIAKVR